MFKSMFKQRPSVTAGKALYAAAVEQARQPALYSDLGAPDTLMGRFELYTLHVVLMVRRLKGQGEQATETAQALFDAYLSGLDVALREMGVGDLSVSKKMKKLGGAFYGRVKAYEEALDAPDATGLQALIVRTVLDGQGEGAALAQYVVGAVQTLDKTPLERLLNGESPWQGDLA